MQVVSVAPSAILGPGVLMGGGFGLPIAAYDDVLLHAHCSVLVLHEPRSTVRDEDRARPNAGVA